ncbi:MAG: rhodanese-like domain-containing protein [Nitriliruptor sp.]|nr:MAG: rhodanese-like domain-containing protein [Nitriliruptor sp.]
MRITTLLLLALAATTMAACASAGATADADAAASADAGASTTERPGVVRIGAPDAVSLMADRDDLTVIDVRTPAEFAEGHLADAELLDIYEAAFRDEIDGLDRDGSYVLYCRTGSRSGQAAAFMQDLGFTEVYDAGGLADLANAGATIVR